MIKEHKHKWRLKYLEGHSEIFALCEDEDCAAILPAYRIERIINNEQIVTPDT